PWSAPSWGVPGRWGSSLLVPRTRGSHPYAASPFANFGLKRATGIMDLLASLSLPKFASNLLQGVANFGIGTLALLDPNNLWSAGDDPGLADRLQGAPNRVFRSRVGNQDHRRGRLGASWIVAAMRLRSRVFLHDRLE